MSFAPVYNEHSRALILGTWPSPKKPGGGLLLRPPAKPLLAHAGGPDRGACARPGGHRSEKSRSSCATGWPCGIRWKVAPSPARRMRPSGTWCPMILPVCWQKHPLRLFFATGLRHIRSIQSISSRSAASRRSGCPAPAPPMPPAGRKKLREIWQKELSNWILP